MGFDCSAFKNTALMRGVRKMPKFKDGDRVVTKEVTIGQRKYPFVAAGKISEYLSSSSESIYLVTFDSFQKSATGSGTTESYYFYENEIDFESVETSQKSKYKGVDFLSITREIAGKS